MRHDPETSAAAYLGGPEALPPGRRADFEAHLLTCEACWDEVRLARDGRALVESLRGVAAAGLRDELRRTIAEAAAPRPAPEPVSPPGRPTHRRGGRRLLAAPAAVLLVAAALGAGLAGRASDASGSFLRPGSSRAGHLADEGATGALVAAVEGFRDGRLPGTRLPSGPAPDLTPLGFSLVAAAGGPLGPGDATMYAYRSATGQRLAVYRSSVAFPDDRAHEPAGEEGAWTMRDGDVVVLCGPGTHTTLLLGTDAGLVERAGDLLRLT